MNVLISCCRSKAIGLGHFSRMSALYNTFFKKFKKPNVFFSVFGDVSNCINELDPNISFCSSDINEYFELNKNFIISKQIDLIVMDYHKNIESYELIEFFKWSKKKDIKLISIDSLLEYRDYLDHIWLPSIFYDLTKAPKTDKNCNISFGWDHFLLRKVKKSNSPHLKNKILIMSGGSDVLGLGDWLPEKIDNELKTSSKVAWIKGPYAKFPDIPKDSKLNWEVYDNPPNLDDLICNADFVLTLFGVSFFESIQYGIPTVVAPLHPNKNITEMKIISEKMAAIVVKNMENAVEALSNLIINNDLAQLISKNSSSLMKLNGCDLFIDYIFQLAKK